MNLLYNDLLQHLFKFLSPIDKINSMRVQRSWNTLLCNNDFFHQLCHECKIPCIIQRHLTFLPYPVTDKRYLSVILSQQNQCAESDCLYRPFLCDPCLYRTNRYDYNKHIQHVLVTLDIVIIFVHDIKRRKYEYDVILYNM